MQILIVTFTPEEHAFLFKKKKGGGPYALGGISFELSSSLSGAALPGLFCQVSRLLVMITEKLPPVIILLLWIWRTRAVLLTKARFNTTKLLLQSVFVPRW